MKEYKTEDVRNIALVSHSGSGKTTLVERLLFDTKVLTRMGNVESGTTTMDFEEEEMERTASINTAIAPIEWNGMKANLLDTPGYVDFVGEVLSALTVAEAAVVLVEAVAGVEVGTELVWQYAAERDLPRLLLVNKMDRENVNVRRLMESVNTLPGKLVRMQLPIGHGPDFQGVVDVLRQKAYLGAEAKEAPVPDDLADDAEEAHLELVEAAAEGDDDLMMKYFEDEPLTEAEIIAGLKKAMMAGEAVPVFFAAPQPGIGVSQFMDYAVRLAPSPNESGPFTATTPAGEATEYPVSDESPLTAFVFKTREDPYGKMSYLRIYGGTLESDTRVYNSTQHSEVRIGALQVLRGKEQLPVQRLHAGDIGAVVKLGETQTNDTLSSHEHRLRLAPIAQPEPILSVAVHPVAQSDTAKLSASLNRLAGEDPTLRWRNEPATRQIIVSGMGNAHLDIAVKKARSKFGLNVTTSVPKIPYRETITRTADAEYTHKKQTGGAGQYARVFLRVETIDQEQEFEFASEVFGGAISAPFVSAVEKGCRQSLESGVIAGYPMTGIRAVVTDGKEHPVDSKEIAFQIAGRECFKKAALEAGPQLLEPIYEVTVTVPHDNMGDIMGDLNSRRARVLGMDQEGTKAVVRAEVPLAEMQTYSADLRSMTQGRGVYRMTFLRYGKVPGHLQEQIVAEAQKERENE
ncbi:MAG: elongation factor G [Anaerolineae bacterium]|nr:elongation factor G [Anaerolineae bacterium]